MHASSYTLYTESSYIWSGMCMANTSSKASSLFHWDAALGIIPEADVPVAVLSGTPRDIPEAVVSEDVPILENRDVLPVVVPEADVPAPKIDRDVPGVVIEAVVSVPKAVVSVPKADWDVPAVVVPETAGKEWYSQLNTDPEQLDKKVTAS